MHWSSFATNDLSFALLTALVSFTVALLILYIRQIQKLCKAQKSVSKAKKETRDIAQLPLNNPYPLIHISKKGDILFANPATAQRFPDLQARGRKHPVLENIEFLSTETTTTREIEVNDVFYHQTITRTRVQEEDTFIVYCYDITDLKNYEGELKAANKKTELARREAEKANQARGDFLANMSHELRTPMNGIIGLSDILVESRLDDEQHELMTAINSSARNLLVVLNDILDFSKIEAGELTMERIPFSLHHVIKQVESLQKPLAARKGLHMESLISSAIPPMIIGDPSRILQILNNLISNALKFTHDGCVTLSADIHAGKGKDFILRISVTDTGIGIPKEKQDSVFTKFHQADSSTSRKFGGTGLGMAITKNLLDLMSGHIHLESEENRGTTFTITLPVQIPSAKTEEAKAKVNPSLNSAPSIKATILVVDDHPVNLLFMRQALKRIGFPKPDEAESGKEALMLFKEKNHGLVFMDCQMPEMDGFVTCQKIRECQTKEKQPVIIAVTADAMKGAREKCKSAGMDDYISKPVDQSVLHRLLQKWIPEDKQFASDPAADINFPLATSSEKESAVFDWRYLREYTQGDKESEKELLEIFKTHLKKDIENLKTDFGNRNFKDWDKTAHKISGSCSHMGAMAMSEICSKAPLVSSDTFEKIQTTHHKILSEYARLCGALHI